MIWTVSHKTMSNFCLEQYQKQKNYNETQLIFPEIRIIY